MLVPAVVTAVAVPVVVLASVVTAPEKQLVAMAVLAVAAVVEAFTLVRAVPGARPAGHPAWAEYFVDMIFSCLMCY